MNNDFLTSKDIEQLKKDDLAFFNSVLSYAIYTDREWIADLQDSRKVINSNFNFEEKKLSKDQTVRNNYENYLYIYLKNNFKPFELNLNNAEYISDSYGYKTDYMVNKGDYVCLNNLARAGYFLSENTDGTKNLHLTFRGTDNKARAFKDFVGDAYLDMSAYYDAFKPLEKAILEYAKDPKNNIKEVQVSGHSLGGAMVQEFFKSKDVKESGLNLNGFTYGAPGTNKNAVYGVLSEFYHAANQKTFKAFKQMTSNVFPKLASLILPSGDELKFVSKFANAIGINGVIDTNILPSTRLDALETDKIQQYEHAGDLIPKSSALVYSKVGHVIPLRDIASKNQKEHWMLTGQGMDKKEPENKFSKFFAGVYNVLIKKPVMYVKNMFEFQYHDMMRYVINLEHRIAKDIQNNDKLKEYTPNLAKFLTHKDFVLDTFERYPVLENERLRKQERENVSIDSVMAKIDGMRTMVKSLGVKSSNTISV